MEINFTWNQNDNENIPIALIKALGINFPDFHTNNINESLKNARKKYNN